ncbi:MAG: MFS transporter [bacterium]
MFTLIRKWFIPEFIPASARVHMPRELTTWATLSITLGIAEGGVMGVIVHHYWSHIVSADTLALAIAIISGAPAFANTTSLVWSKYSHGKHKIHSISLLMIATSICIFLLTFVPATKTGLFVFLALGISARLLWSGVITLRANIWRANFPRDVRATLAGKLAALSAVLVSITGAFSGWLLQNHADQFHFIFPVAAGMGIIGALTYRRLRMRGHQALLNSEKTRANHNKKTSTKPDSALLILKQDPMYRDYLIVMFVFGSGNLMTLAPLILVLNELNIDRFQQMLITSSLPLAILPFSIGLWARFLDQSHVIRFRLKHSWSFVIALALYAIASISNFLPLFWLGSLVLGVAYAGGMLGWNLGHHDFAPPEKATQYMGLHVTLTGVRGLIMPLIGVMIFQWFTKNTHINPGWAMLLPFTLSLSGAFGFIWLHHKYKKQLSGRPELGMIETRSSSGS